jgi:hypothetical protein
MPVIPALESSELKSLRPTWAAIMSSSLHSETLSQKTKKKNEKRKENQ